MENPNKNQDLNKNQNVRPGQTSPETKDFSKKNEGQYSNDSSRSGEINRGQNGQNQKRDENLRQ